MDKPNAADQDENVVFSYLWLRFLIGLVAIFLAGLVQGIAGEPLLPTVSHSYWTGARDFFVGSLYIIFAFLVAYNGRGPVDFWTTKVACLTSFGVAFFPTCPLPTHRCSGGPPPPSCPSGACPLPNEGCLPGYLDWLGQHVSTAHTVCAVVLLLCLVVLVVNFIRHALGKLPAMTLRKPTDAPVPFITVWCRVGIYAACLVAMVISLGIGAAYALCWVSGDRVIYWVEFWALLAFGIAWLTAGSYRYVETQLATLHQ
ncbi:MAG: hypothetical protein AAGA68_26290 [Pseudomonadota bacterium]